MIVAIMAAGFWVFARGFLLTRMVLPDRSVSSELPYSGVTTAENTCEWYPAKFERVIVLVVDALRVDFATWSSELNTTAAGKAKPYHNQLPVLGRLGAARPDQAQLFRFRADPPTTTLQRLKGLTTGQLPTFIDAGSNFAGSAIDEDNWLQALRRQPAEGCDAATGRARTGARNVVFLGDDTWLSLFPEELRDTQAAETSGEWQRSKGWARVREFPSLNVWDLDTVDDGVFSRLPELLLGPEAAETQMSAAQATRVQEQRQRWRELVRQQQTWEHADFEAAGMGSAQVDAAQLHGEWEVIVAHGLGVDHCGHRFGPEHAAIGGKLAQMNAAIELIVEAIDGDKRATALVVLGDHGMDDTGDHGGDSPREVDAALWVYANRPWRSAAGDARAARVLRAAEARLAGEPLDTDLRHGWWHNTHLSDAYGGRVTAPEQRSVAQIDLVPTLALALGLPVPFNSLGAVIPEMFAGDGDNGEWGLLRALRLNAAQTLRYIDAYAAASPAHGFPATTLRLWRDMHARAESAYQTAEQATRSGRAAAEEEAATEYFVLQRTVLGALRQMWAQFDAALIAVGLATLAMSLVAAVLVYVRAQQQPLESIALRATRPLFGGAMAGVLIARALQPLLVAHGASHATALEATGAGTALGAATGLCVGLWGALTGLWSESVNAAAHNGSATAAVPLLAAAAVGAALHCMAFLSNSFTVSEDSVVLFATQTLVLVAGGVAVRAAAVGKAQGAAARRALACAAALAVLNRIAALSTVCREEQLPRCTPTFYGAAAASVSPLWLAAANVLMVWLVPLGIKRVLRRSRSDRAVVARLWVGVGMHLSMALAAAHWLLDAFDARAAAQTPGQPDWADVRVVLARLAAGVALGGGVAAWHASPLCVDVTLDEGAADVGAAPRRAVVLGFGNAFGAAHVLFISAVFCVLYLVQQPAGGVVLSMTLAALLLSAELFDALRDALPPAAALRLLPAHAVMMAQLAFLGFFATGHQFTLASIQWNVAFVGMRDMHLVVCGVLVALNTLAPFVLAALCVPLSVLWNESLAAPALNRDPARYLARISGAAALHAVYYLLVALSTAACAAYFRRHLMVWKVFAPRFMFAVPVTLVTAAVALFIAVGFAVTHVLRVALSVGGVKALVARSFAQR
ncbi:alkaline phosphatase-like protein [Coemansia reversa NRRL 1564]|uniref:Alkaline phosphatase-like protein n=1 Tax=Coemansia reversa (strain ATCC 12441 / NRRL 1564) TaxID=763665 RepID=A0A2G5BC35_COERN|nr:alkaline phosphatase-like protein [Coemansia reversa NRRL 1564]|eukprot:PIA16570.1 alkaline phosphatase-like protein [Coemansia reversa NRRL 1564]